MLLLLWPLYTHSRTRYTGQYDSECVWYFTRTYVARVHPATRRRQACMIYAPSHCLFCETVERKTPTDHYPPRPGVDRYGEYISITTELPGLTPPPTHLHLPPPSSPFSLLCSCALVNYWRDSTTTPVRSFLDARIGAWARLGRTFV